MTVLEIAAVCAPIIAAGSGTIAYRQMRFARRQTESSTRPILTASIETRETPGGPSVHLFLNNSAQTAPALDVLIETSFTPRSADVSPDRTERIQAPVVLPQSRIALALPPALICSPPLIDDFVVDYSSVTVRATYHVKGIRRSLRMHQTLSTLLSAEALRANRHG